MTPRIAQGDEAWIALGSNLGDRRGFIEGALAAFSTEVVEISPIFETPPWGPIPQPDFLNAVARLRWPWGAPALLERCLSVERSFGRVRDVRWGPRTLDLDVLLVGPELFREADLQVPHGGLASRSFVLDPWAAVAPELLVPGLGRTVAELAEALRLGA